METLQRTSPAPNRVERGAETPRRRPSAAAADPSASEPTGPRSNAPADGALHQRRLARNVSQLLGSHAVAALCGIASLPIVARNLGPAGYGEFSLFVLLLGVVTYQDFLRPLLVREWSRGVDVGEERDLGSLSLVTTCAIASLATIVGAIVLSPFAALAFAIAAALYSLASVDHARLAAAGRIGLAGTIRNTGVACAMVAAMALSFAAPAWGWSAVHVYAWPFLATNTLVFLVQRRVVGGTLVVKPDRETWRRARAAFRAHRSTILNLVAFGAATAVVVSTDRVLLDHLTDAVTFGTYAGCVDLAIKMTVVGTALGMALFPALSRAWASDPAAATRRFVRLASWILCGWFGLVLTLVLAHRAIVATVLGADFVPGHALYAWVLVGTFVHMLGFLLTPWQRARGEFGTQTRAYALAGTGMVAVGLATVPVYGPVGAVACYLTARSAEVLLLVAEARTLPRDVLPRWKLAVLATMIASLAVAAWFTSGGAT